MVAAPEHHNRVCQPSTPNSPTTLQPIASFITAVVPPENAVGMGGLAVMLYVVLDVLLRIPPTGLQRAFARSPVTNRAKF